MSFVFFWGGFLFCFFFPIAGNIRAASQRNAGGPWLKAEVSREGLNLYAGCGTTDVTGTVVLFLCLLVLLLSSSFFPPRFSQILPEGSIIDDSLLRAPRACAQLGVLFGKAKSAEPPAADKEAARRIGQDW